MEAARPDDATRITRRPIAPDPPGSVAHEDRAGHAATERPTGPAWPLGKPWPEAQPLGSGPPPDDIMIEFRDLYKSFGEKHILRGVTMAIPKGVSTVIMGGSGTGKSVTIKHVVGLLRADKGEVWVHGENVDELSKDGLDQLRLKIGFLFQSGALFDSMTVYEQMDFVLKRHTDLDADGRKDRIMETLEWVNLPKTTSQYPSELSGGQRKRIGLARSIILQPDIMVYDEPTTGLDPISVRVVSNLINRLRDERGITSMTITHDLLCAEMISDHVFYLLDGVYAESGTLAEVAQSDKPEIREFFGDEYAMMFKTVRDGA